jgi:pilus assembly protein Flp/PilA
MNGAFAHIIGFLGPLQGRLEGSKDRGATAVEYGLLVGLIAVGIIVAVTALRNDLVALFNAIAAAL